ncbi:MAG: hypothetical protein HY820_18815 [Acidobacteria bacterium]|nr:hypothetical protein [Acidobacteriota bacterium]
MKKILMVALAAVMLSAQEKKESAPPVEQEAAVISVKNLNGDALRRLSNMLGVITRSISYDERMKVIMVYGPKSTLEQVRKVVAELDKPASDASRNIEMTLTMLRCGGAASGTPLPADMEAVAKQLRAANLCKDVHFWDMMPMHLQEGKDAQGDVTLPNTNPPVPGMTATLRVQVKPESVNTRSTGRYVRFDRLQANLNIRISTPGHSTERGTGINTAGEFKEGQKTVLGKISGAEGDTAVFVVIAIRVLE